MRIAYLGLKGIPAQGGAETVAEAVIRRLSDRHEMVVYCCKRYTPPEADVPGVRLIRFPTIPGKHTRITSLDVLSAVHALLWGDYDLIHVHSVETCFVLPLLRLRFRIVSTSHGQSYVWDKWGSIARFLMELTEYPFVYLSHEITAVSALLARYYEERYGRRTNYIPNGIDIDVRPDAAGAQRVIESAGLGGKDFILFASARIIQAKGCDLLLRAFADLSEPCDLIMVGDFDQRPEYSRFLESLADQRTHFVPLLTDKQVLLGLIQKCRLFVFPSTYEAMSMVLLEVASLGAPLVCSDIPQNVAVLGDRALYFKSGDASDLTEKMHWALGHPAEMKELALRARDWVRANFSWDTIADQYHALYVGAMES